MSHIDQLDGNASLNSSIVSNLHFVDTDMNKKKPKNDRAPMKNQHRLKNASVANHLPIVSVCNARSLFPKISNFKTDFFERSVDFSLCCEVWQKSESRFHKDEIEKMLELDGLKYFSTPRPHGKRGGGAAIIASTRNFQTEKLEIQIPHKLEIVWAVAKCKNKNAQFKNIILCSFYSPP